MGAIILRLIESVRTQKPNLDLGCEHFVLYNDSSHPFLAKRANNPKQPNQSSRIPHFFVICLLFYVCKHKKYYFYELITSKHNNMKIYKQPLARILELQCSSIIANSVFNVNNDNDAETGRRAEMPGRLNNWDNSRW